MSSSESSWVRCNGCVRTSPERRLYLTNCNHIFCLPCLGADAKDKEVNCPKCTSRTRISEINSNLENQKLLLFKDTDWMFNRIMMAHNEKMKEFDKSMKVLGAVTSFQRRHYKINMQKMSMERKQMTSLIDKLEKEKKDLIKDNAQLNAALMDKDATMKEKNEVTSGLKCELTRGDGTIKKDESAVDELKAKIRWLSQMLMERKEREKILSERVRELSINYLNVGRYPRVINPKISPNNVGICRGYRTNIAGRQRSQYDASLYYQNEVAKTMGRDMKLPHSAPVKKSCLRSMVSRQIPKTPCSKVRFSEVEEMLLMDNSGSNSSRIFSCGGNKVVAGDDIFNLCHPIKK
uniref:RING-type domain-containing protein n=1 Tax=Strongyloides venezuelensis TaxID=75913 RepID=A0A0K0F4X5_STRVS